MVRKWLCAWLLALLLPVAAAAEIQVIDEAKLIDAAMEQEITAAIETIEREHQIDLVVLVTTSVPEDNSESMWRIRDYADVYYENNGFGMGPDASGLMYMIDMGNRAQWISTSGVMIDYINDMREEMLLDEGGMYLPNHPGMAALSVMREVGRFMDEGRMKGSFRYDEATGERLTGLYNPLESHEVLIAAGAGIAAMLVMGLSVTAKYSLSGSTYRYDLGDNASCTLTKDEETFLRETVSRMRRPSESSSGGSGNSGKHSSSSRGSGTHTSSGGGSHGGGGRRF